MAIKSTAEATAPTEGVDIEAAPPKMKQVDASAVTSNTPTEETVVSSKQVETTQEASAAGVVVGNDTNDGAKQETPVHVSNGMTNVANQDDKSTPTTKQTDAPSAESETGAVASVAVNNVVEAPKPIKDSTDAAVTESAVVDPELAQKGEAIEVVPLVQADETSPKFPSDDDTHGNVVEHAIPPLASTTTEAQPPPESAATHGESLTIEQGVPSDATQVPKNDKSDDRDGSDTELGNSFDSTEPSKDSDDDNVDHNDSSLKKPPPRRRRRNNFIFATLIVLLLVGAVLGILFGTGVVTKTESNPVQTGPQGGETFAPPAVTPTMSPASDVPAPAPTNGNGDTASQPQPPTETAVPGGDALLDALKALSPGAALDDPTSPQYQAYLWMANEDELLSEVMAEPAKLPQRYAVVTLYTALKGSVPVIYSSRNECQWPTISCGTHRQTNNQTNIFEPEAWQVTEISLARQLLSGSIPGEIGLLAPSLVSLDLGENSISGSIPDELYQLVNLKYLYLHDNAIGGTLSEDIGNLQLLDELFLGSNQIGGKIPYNIGSRAAVRRPLRFLILHDNQFEGPIPDDMKLSKIFHLDLSFNKLNGTLPSDIGDFRRLRQLYLDHNQFTGSIPESYAQAGGGRLYALTVNDNQLTGGVPSGWVSDNLYIDTINVENNMLTEVIDKSICKFSALSNGELVELGAECDICPCDVLCDKCY